ncbi:toll-like receptor 13 [Podarcis raffonei]|uniref:toll-like receptor 13 n=1 Tax=Podarcis raffonei TaxID=65483 RepID=UPI0023297C7B|nr:toll-like receptor 13 [Podarcis raffonei]
MLKELNIFCMKLLHDGSLNPRWRRNNCLWSCETHSMTYRKHKELTMPNFRLVSMMLCVLLAFFVWPHQGVHSFGLAHCILSPNRPGLATCSGQAISNLTSVTLQLPNSTRWLNASNNKVTHLTSTTFSHLPHLLELYLDHNNISGIEYNAFQSLEDLEVLDLSWNQLVSVESSMLPNLRNLRELFLGHNSIATLHPSSLISQVALQELHLPNNNLSSLQEVATATQGLANLTFLDLGSNQISTPCMGPSWIVFPSLRNLSLNSNGISRLDLSNCSFPNLQQLNLTHNNMLQVEAGSFRATPVLVELSFNMNPLDISQLINATLPNLTMLHLSSMNPPLNESMSAACSFFKSLPSLTSLDIQHSQMNDTQLRQLGSCTNLTWLDLSTTGYKYLKNGAFETFQGLEFLSLEKCKVLRLSSSAWGKQMQLRTLILRRNSISQLEDSVFRPLNHLSYLDLSKNHLTNLQQRSFFGMEALRTLILQGCQITAVTRNTFHYARKMEFLDLRDNSIKLIKPRAFLLKHVGTLLLSGNKILTVKRNGFYQLNSLRYLYLDHNLLYKLSRGVFTPLKKLEILDISHNHLFTYNKYDYPSPFVGLRSLRKLDLSFQSPRLPICPPDKVLQGLGNLRYLSLKGNPSLLFLNISFVNLTSLKSLDVSEISPFNDSWKPSLNFFQGLGNLSQLWIDDSAIKDLPEQIFSGLTSLEQLSLSKNDLRNISKKTLGGLSSLKYLDVSGNPLTCSCDNAWFQNWSVSEPNIQVSMLGSYHCFGPGTTDRLFAYEDFSFCFETRGIYFFIATTVITLCFLFTVLVYAKFGWTLRHGYYLLRGWGFKRLRQKGQEYQYDAYISCCSQDHEWVVNNVLEKLEVQGEPSLRLCFGPRDFAPGEYYIDNVQNGISQSRKTLCVVSDNYLESEWCSLEIQLACSKIYYQREDPLVVVFMEEIPNYRLSPYHRLRKLMKQESYLTWPEDPEAENVFWTKLYEALSCGDPEQNTTQFGVTC